MVYTLIRISENNCLYIDDGIRMKKLNHSLPGEIKDSPNKEITAFISPKEWEVSGDIYLMFRKTGEFKKLELENDNLTPKDFIWINDDLIAYIYGPIYGTIEVGGNIFLINIHSLNYEQLTYFDKSIQVTNLVDYNERKIRFKGRKYIDKEYNDFIEFEDEVKF